MAGAARPVPVAASAGVPDGQRLAVLHDPHAGPAALASAAPPVPGPSAFAAANSSVLAVPVRIQADSRSEAGAVRPGAVNTLVPTPEGEFWHAVVAQLVAADAITALVRELALQSQLVARDTDQWLLRVERESLNQPNNRERLATALAGAGHVVSLSVEIGRVTDSPARRNAAKSAERQLAAERVIFEDPFVQTMMRDFGAKIVPGSIKPL